MAPLTVRIRFSAARLLVVLAGTCFLLLSATACGGGPGSAPTPDPFSGLSQRADEAFLEGLDLFEQGRYRDALSAFERARVLSPSTDPRIDQMIDQTRARLAPSPTLGPPTSTPAETPTPVFLNRATPDAELGSRYFGQAFLTVVPGRSILPPPVNEFYFEDQVGLYIEALNQRLRLPFSLRVFDLDSGRVVANVRSDGVPPPSISTGPRTSGAAAPPPGGAPAAATTPGAQGAPTPFVGPPSPGEFQMVRFWDNFVWYHEGGEPPGRYRVELYNNGTMTHAFDYLVGNVPVALPVPITPTPAVEPFPFPMTPGGEFQLPPESAPGKPDLGTNGGPSAPAPTPLPTATPTAAPAASTVIGGLPSGLDLNAATDRVYIADASGVVWTVDRNRPTLNKPFNLERLPVDIAVDQTTGNLYISTRSRPGVAVLNGDTGQRLTTIELPVNPGDVRLDSALGLLYVVLPESQAVSVIDVRTGNILRSTSGLPQVTGMAIDPASQELYLSHMSGQLSILNGTTGQITGRLAITSAGLSGLTAAAGHVYGINTATRELVVVDPETREVSRIKLSEEPGGVVAGDTSGTVYVLGTKTNAVLRINPATGAEVGRVLLPGRSGNFGLMFQQQRDFLSLRPRMAINRGDETVYVTQPESGTLSVIPPVLFPALARGAVRTETLAQRPLAPAVTATPTLAPGRAAPATPASRVLATPTLAARPLATPMTEPSFARRQELPAASIAAAEPRAALPPSIPLRLPAPASGRESIAAVGQPHAIAGQPGRFSGLEWPTAAGRFFTQTNGFVAGLSLRGFAITDAGPLSFWSSYQKLGGMDRLGYPTSHRFAWRTDLVQLTQRAVLQWAPATGDVALANVMDLLHDVDKDDLLLNERQIPKQMSYTAEGGLSPEQVRARRLALLDADPVLRARYFASPDPLTEYGLPTSRVVDVGPVVAVRTQRGVLQRWKNAMPWAGRGEVTTVLAGDLARDFGLFGAPVGPFDPEESGTGSSPERVAALRQEGS